MRDYLVGDTSTDEEVNMTLISEEITEDAAEAENFLEEMVLTTFSCDAKNFEEAIKNPEWKATMVREIDSIQKNQTKLRK